MFSLEYSLTSLMLAIVPFVFLVTDNYGKYLKKLRKVFQDTLAESSVVAEESISSIKTVRSFAAEEKIINEYNKGVSKSFSIHNFL